MTEKISKKYILILQFHKNTVSMDQYHFIDVNKMVPPNQSAAILLHCCSVAVLERLFHTLKIFLYLYK